MTDVTHPARVNRNDWVLPIVFLLSGFCGLVYEIVWVRMLTNHVGGSQFAVSLVVTVFMGGLALGSYWASRFLKRMEPTDGGVGFYGALEMGIGVYGMAFPLIVSAVKPVYMLLYQQLGTVPVLYDTASALLSGLLLLPPTTLMGMTLPILCRYWIRTVRNAGGGTGWLYGINTVGGALGAVLCGFWMIERCGVRGSLFIAVGVNLAIGLLCIVLFGLPHRLTARPDSGGMESGAARPRQDIPLMAVVAISGFCCLAYEIVWTKLLGLLIGPTTYSFTVVLFTFITGLALGSIVFGRLADRSSDPVRLLAGLQFGAALSAVLVSQFLGHSQLLFAKLILRYRDAFQALQIAKVGVLFAAMLLPTILLGGTLPIAARIRIRDRDGIGEGVGRLYAVSTIGALLGSACAGFLLIPWIGKQGSLSALVVLQAAVAFPLLIRAGAMRGRSALALAGAAALACGMVLPTWNVAALAQGKYQRVGQLADWLASASWFDTLVRHPPGRAGELRPDEILYAGEGIGGFVAVAQVESGLLATNRYLLISGKTEASTVTDLSTMTLTAHIPMMLHPGATDVLVVGLASGITAGEILHYPVRTLDVAEISPEVVRACALFSEWNNGILRDPRARIVVQDARAHLALTDRTYDVIISEPSNPWMAGVAGLFTRDFFEMAKGRLKPNGIFAQWFHTYQSDWEVFALFARTFGRVFPDGMLLSMAPGSRDYLFVGSREGRIELTRERLERNLAWAQRSANMSMAGGRMLLPLVQNENIPELAGEGPIHEDERPLLEYLAPRKVYAESRELEERIHGGRNLRPATLEMLREFEDMEVRVQFAEFLSSMNASPYGLVDVSGADAAVAARYRNAVMRFAERNPIAAYPSIRAATDRKLVAETQIATLGGYMRRTCDQRVSAEVLASVNVAMGDAWVAREDYPHAQGAYLRALLHTPGDSAILYNLAACLEVEQDHARAIEVLRIAMAGEKPKAAQLARLAANYVKVDKPEAAKAFFEEALMVDPRYVPALVSAGALCGTMGDYKSAVSYLQRALAIDPRNGRGWMNLALALNASGHAPEALEAVEKGLAADPKNEGLAKIKAAMVGSRQ